MAGVDEREHEHDASCRLESILTDTSAPLARRVWAAGAVELRLLSRLAAPAVVVYMINYVMSMSTQIFSGHLGNLELAAASLGNTGVQTFAYGLMDQLQKTALKVCSRTSLERPPQACFKATTSLAVVREGEQQRMLPWTIFHGRVSSVRWFCSSSESPDKILAAQVEEKKQELHYLLRQMDELRTSKCEIAAMEKKNKASEKMKQKENKKLLLLLSLGEPLHQMRRHVQISCTLLVITFVSLIILLAWEDDFVASKERGPTPRRLPSAYDDEINTSDGGGNMKWSMEA